jgi:general stress protein 26
MGRQLTKGSSERLVTERNIWVVTVRSNGRPHMVPVWFVWADENLYICIEPRSVKARNLESNKNVSMALEEGNHPVICEGEARLLNKPWPEPVVEGFRQKYDWDIVTENRYTQLVEVTPRKWLHW